MNNTPANMDPQPEHTLNTLKTGVHLTHVNVQILIMYLIQHIYIVNFLTSLPVITLNQLDSTASRVTTS